MLLLGVIPFSLGWLGGGDVKLLAACACVFGLGRLMPLLLYTALSGGVLALIIALVTRQLGTVVGGAARAAAGVFGRGAPSPVPSARTRLPYAIAILVGVAWLTLGDTVIPRLNIF